MQYLPFCHDTTFSSALRANTEVPAQRMDFQPVMSSLPLCRMQSQNFMIRVTERSCYCSEQASSCFRGSLGPPAGREQKGREAFVTLNVNFRCSQESIDAIVTALYTQTMDLDVENFKEIMDVADYLQVMSAYSLAGSLSALTKPPASLPILLHSQPFIPCC